MPLAIDYAQPTTRGQSAFQTLLSRLTPILSACLWVLVYLAMGFCVITAALIPIVLVAG
jgi:hypothetical protein